MGRVGRSGDPVKESHVQKWQKRKELRILKILDAPRCSQSVKGQAEQTLPEV